MSIEVRTVHDDELIAFIDTLTTGFIERPSDPARIADEVRPFWDRSRLWAAFDDGRPCGTFRSWATELTVPGGARLPGSAIAAVSVLPSHRRRGILRAMTAAEHGAIRERGEVVGLLHAAEWPIYGRFGYGPATQEATWQLDTRQATVRGEPTGRVDIIAADAAARDRAMSVYEAWRLRETGSLRRRAVSWEYDFGLVTTAWGEDWKGFVAVHEDASGETDGYLRYSRAEDRWERHQPQYLLRIDELVALTDTAYDDLWRFAAGMDWVATVKAERRLPTERLPWILSNARAASVSDVGDDLWVRIFDAQRALEARTYERVGRIVLEIVDREASGGRTRLLLDAGPDGARCRPTDRSPDLTIDVSALGAAYLGGTRLRDAVTGSGADEHRPGALLETEHLLRTLDAPWCTTFF
jgi:predicted acetyltransferase